MIFRRKKSGSANCNTTVLPSGDECRHASQLLERVARKFGEHLNTLTAKENRQIL